MWGGRYSVLSSSPNRINKGGDDDGDEVGETTNINNNNSLRGHGISSFDKSKSTGSTITATLYGTKRKRQPPKVPETKKDKKGNENNAEESVWNEIANIMSGVVAMMWVVAMCICLLICGCRKYKGCLPFFTCLPPCCCLKCCTNNNNSSSSPGNKTSMKKGGHNV